MLKPPANSYNHPSTLHPDRARGFTLIELLVVISIIALLIAILLPALQSARTAAQNVACLSTVRQLAVAANAYEADYGVMPTPYPSQSDRNHPNGPIWIQVFLNDDYITSGADRSTSLTTLVCPIVAKEVAPKDPSYQGDTYVYNGRLGGWDNSKYNANYELKARSSDGVDQPSKTIMFTEKRDIIPIGPGAYRHSSYVRDFFDTTAAHIEQYTGAFYSTPWGPREALIGTSNAAMVDGSASNYRLKVDRHPLLADNWGDDQLVIKQSDWP